MKEKKPFYNASSLEILKILLMAVGGAVISIATLMLIFLTLNENPLPMNTVWSIVISIGALGFCCGMGWYQSKYTKLPAAGGVIGFVAGLTAVIFFSNSDLLIKTPMAFAAGIIYAASGSFLVWIDPEAYSE